MLRAVCLLILAALVAGCSGDKDRNRNKDRERPRGEEPPKVEKDKPGK